MEEQKSDLMEESEDGDYRQPALQGQKQEAIDLHHASPMMATIAALREKYDLHMTVERYTKAEIPETEDKFIRK